MAIPSKEVFEAWLALGREPPMINILGTIDESEIPSINLQERIAQAEAAYVAQGRTLVEMEPFKWLNNQQACVFAIQKLSKKYEQPNTAKGWIFEPEDFREAVANPKFARRVLQRYAQISRSETWFYRVINGLYEYLYSDTSKKMLSARRDAVKATHDLARAVQKFNDISEFLHATVESSPSPYPLMQRLESRAGYAASLAECLPVQRNTQNKSEQLLAYRIYNANRATYRKVQPEAIAYLMNIEGIRGTVDLRTIERWCKGFNERRQLLRKLRG